MFGRKAKRNASRGNDALPGRSEAVEVPPAHFVNGNPLEGPVPRDGLEVAVFGMGCFWGAESTVLADGGCLHNLRRIRRWRHTESLSYEEVCSGMTGHAEVVQVVYDPSVVVIRRAAERFSGRPTIRPRDTDKATTSAPNTDRPSIRLLTSNTIRPSGPRTCIRRWCRPRDLATSRLRSLHWSEYFFAEDYHQQYLGKNPARLRLPRQHRPCLPGPGLGPTAPTTSNLHSVSPGGTRCRLDECESAAVRAGRGVRAVAMGSRSSLDRLGEQAARTGPFGLTSCRGTGCSWFVDRPAAPLRLHAETSQRALQLLCPRRR